MELRVLRYFLAVAREQSISGAAEMLHISQPTLSRQLMDMEHALGKQLFIRGNRHITLTEEGIFLRKRAEEIVDLVDKTETEIRSSDEFISGDIYIGAAETDNMRLLLRVAHKLQQDYPDIHYHFFSGNAQDVTEKLDQGLLDFGLLIDYNNLSKYESLLLPSADSWCVLMRNDSPLAAKEQIMPADLWDKPLICSQQIFWEKQDLKDWIKKDIEELKAERNKLENALIKKAYELKVINHISSEETTNNEIIRNVLLTKIISMENINLLLEDNNEVLEIKLYDADIYEKSIVIPVFNKKAIATKFNKTIRLFI